MVKWYNESLPRISREFDSPWPHRNKKQPASAGVFCRCCQSECPAALTWRIERRRHVSVSFPKTETVEPRPAVLMSLSAIQTRRISNCGTILSGGRKRRFVIIFSLSRQRHWNTVHWEERRMHDITYIDVPALNVGTSPVNLDVGIKFFRKTLAHRLGFNADGDMQLRYAIHAVHDAGFELLGRSELSYLLEQAQLEKPMGKKLDFIRKARPFQMPILLFPKDDKDSMDYPGLASLAGWSQVSVKSTVRLCSNRFLLPVKGPVT